MICDENYKNKKYNFGSKYALKIATFHKYLKVTNNTLYHIIYLDKK